ncbi:tail-specific protease Tsp [Simkania negevensis]|uniref:Tail-specific protease n=1 Tax=Simkania negevensis (strain ATCC VR-1471 / DSM 27360 / Z) TaxID=331113 RepID=F8L678_SIMNZ|nr:S41 family peptidase [Simkania negevensis]CCB88208.1 tail-specific protease [Simkania negevensis Z]
MGFRRFIFFCLFFLTGLGQSLFSDDFTLAPSNVRETMEKMFAYHVENREFSPIVVRRSFKVYIQQFDPERLYLLKGEVEGFLSIDNRMVNQVIRDYRYDRFPAYAQLNQAIQKAIARQQKIRQEVVGKILREGPAVLSQPLPDEDYDYAKNSKELYERVYFRLIRDMKYSLKKKGVSDPSPELLKKILIFRESKVTLSEQSYLPQESEELNNHYLTLHILKAMAKSLDAHSGYYSPKEAYEIRANLKKEFSGIGVVFREDFDGIYVADLIQGGPAHRSQQVEIGDALMGLNGQSVTEMHFEEVLDLMKGGSGSKVTLQLQKQKTKEQHTVQLVREKIVMNDDRLSVEFEPFADGVIGKINMPGFYDNGADVSAEKDLREALRTLRNHGKIYGIVLDLRENSGGFLTQAIKVSAMFINGGIIVVSKYADGEVSYARDVDGRHYYSGPFAVLISKASASAAEIVAAALQDHGAALIVGDERSYGKGSMQYQTLTDERATSFFKVTVGRYYTASGRSPQITGVKSDILVPTIFHPYNIGERYLEHPIASDQLTGEVFGSLNKVKKGSFRDREAISVPYLAPHPSEWRQMLSQLQANSQERLSKDRNFQFFLKIAEGYRPKRTGFQSRRESVVSNYGAEDLQMKEAVEIVKDMALIYKLNN